MTTNDRMLTSAEAAAFFGTTVKTLDTWAYQRTGPAFYKVGRRRLYRMADIEQFLAERRVEPLAEGGAVVSMRRRRMRRPRRVPRNGEQGR